MRPGFPIKFRFRLIPFIATVLLVALGVSLGQWQDRRAEYKMAQELRLQAGRTAAPLDIGAQPISASLVEFRRVRMGQRSDWKKAYVKLREGEKIPEFLEGA